MAGRLSRLCNNPRRSPAPRAYDELRKFALAAAAKMKPLPADEQNPLAKFAPATSCARSLPRQFQGLSWEEVAACLGGTAGARRNQLARAIDRVSLELRRDEN
jgi:hypothetical protein